MTGKGDNDNQVAATETTEAVTPEIPTVTTTSLVGKAKEIESRRKAESEKRLEQEIEEGAWPKSARTNRYRDGTIVDYPSHFARLPIFKATYVDPKGPVPQIPADKPEVIITPWGHTDIWGQRVYSYDDVTFVALVHLCRSEEFTGPRKSHARKIGLRVVDPKTSLDDEVEKLKKSWQLEQVRLEAGRTNVKEICEFLGDARNGDTRLRRKLSIKRLRSINMTHHVVKGIRLARPSFYVPAWMVDEDGVLKNDMEWDDRLFYYSGHDEVEGDFHITWTESMTAMLTSYTKIDAQVYAQLSPHSRCLYKYGASMVSKNSAHTIRFHKLSLYVDFAGKLSTLDKVKIPIETMYRIMAMPDDLGADEVRSMRIDWREMKRTMEDAAESINSKQSRFEMYVPKTERGDIPKLRILVK